MHESLRWVAVHISISYSDYVYVQNLPSKKYICLKKLLGVLRGGVGWGLGLMLARRGDNLISDSQTFSAMVVQKGRHFPFCSALFTKWKGDQRDRMLVTHLVFDGKTYPDKTFFLYKKKVLLFLLNNFARKIGNETKKNCFHLWSWLWLLYFKTWFRQTSIAGVWKRSNFLLINSDLH